ncbi:hypothetical protein [Haloarcula litorea]|uniref:hypothetical protein n=1 Tax=Haloarcula litorea TaxID=3032579 RepID=UPI0023E7FF9E|nr:hypothetical protein [Halomicroarcula sp. GDY20]
MIEDHGPYAYRVTYDDGEHHWDYLGPVGGESAGDMADKRDDEGTPATDDEFRTEPFIAEGEPRSEHGINNLSPGDRVHFPLDGMWAEVVAVEEGIATIEGDEGNRAPLMWTGEGYRVGDPMDFETFDFGVTHPPYDEWRCSCTVSVLSCYPTRKRKDGGKRWHPPKSTNTESPRALRDALLNEVVFVLECRPGAADGAAPPCRPFYPTLCYQEVSPPGTGGLAAHVLPRTFNRPPR